MKFRVFVFYVSIYFDRFVTWLHGPRPAWARSVKSPVEVIEVSEPTPGAYVVEKRWTANPTTPTA